MGRDPLGEKGLERDKGGASTDSLPIHSRPHRLLENITERPGRNRIKTNQGRRIFSVGGAFFYKHTIRGKNKVNDLPFKQNRKWGCNLSELSNTVFYYLSSSVGAQKNGRRHE